MGSCVSFKPAASRARRTMSLAGSSARLTGGVGNRTSVIENRDRGRDMAASLQQGGRSGSRSFRWQKCNEAPAPRARPPVPRMSLREEVFSNLAQQVLVGLERLMMQPCRRHLAGALQPGTVCRDDQVAVEHLVGQLQLIDEAKAGGSQQRRGDLLLDDVLQRQLAQLERHAQSHRRGAAQDRTINDVIAASEFRIVAEMTEEETVRVNVRVQPVAALGECGG